MTTETKHTQGPACIPHKDRPWQIQLGTGKYACYAQIAPSEILGAIDVANAKRIVVCWNAHDDLLNACKALAAIPSSAILFGEATNAHELACAALAKAEDSP